MEKIANYTPRLAGKYKAEVVPSLHEEVRVTKALCRFQGLPKFASTVV
jgi:hypothetical protein